MAIIEKIAPNGQVVEFDTEITQNNLVDFFNTVF